MYYQQKPKPPTPFKALYIEENTAPVAIARWIGDNNPMHLLKHFTTNRSGKALYLLPHHELIREEAYLIYQDGEYRVCDKDTFEQLYEPVSDMPTDPTEPIEPEPSEPVEPEPTEPLEPTEPIDGDDDGDDTGAEGEPQEPTEPIDDELTDPDEGENAP